MLARGEECAFGDAGFLHGDHLRKANGTVMAIKNDAKGRPRKQGSFGLYREGKATPEILFTVQVVLTARRWRALLDEQLRPIGQSSARMEALSAIYNSPPLSPQVDIARRLRIEGPTLTRMLDTLEKDGLVERLADPADRRQPRVQRTGYNQSSCRNCGDRKTTWCPDTGRRRTGAPARPCGRSSHRLRFLYALRSQGVRAQRRRRSVCPSSLARHTAPLPGWW